MSETDPFTSPASDNREVDAPETGAPAPGPVSNPFLSHLQSLRELQITLSQEGRPEAILGEGTTGTVEIVGADCAVAVIEPSNGLPPLRFGWIEGRQMAQHEIGMVMRRLDEPIQRVRTGQTARVLLGAAGDEEPEGGPGEGPGARTLETMRSPGFGSTIVLGIDASMGSRGALVLARHDPLPFSCEQILLADLLATLMAIQIERALRATDARHASERLQEDCGAATRRLHETTIELQAINTVAAAAAPSLDLDRQIDISLRKALEVTRFKAGAIFLMADTGSGEALRFARGVGEPAYVELTRGRAVQKGLGVAGRVWERGEPVVIADLSADLSLEGHAGELVALRRAGYRALACVPLMARGSVIGTMELLSTEARPELESRPSLAQAIAAQIAIVIQNGRVLSDVMRHSLGLEAQLTAHAHDLARSQQLIAVLRETLESARRSNDLREILEEALGRAVDLLELAAGTVHLVDPGTRALHLKAQRGLPPAVVDDLGSRVSRTMVGRVLATGEPIVGSAEEVDRLGTDGLRFRAAVPLRAMSGVHGVLAVAGRGDSVLPETMSRTFAAVGEILGLLVENARAFQGASPAGPSLQVLPAQLVQAQKMESIGTLAGGIAHEFNNLLGAILGYAGHIRGLTTPDNPIHRHAITIEQQSRRAAELTQQLLAFARGGQYTLGPVDLNQSIAEAVSFLSRSLDPRIVMETRPDPDLPLIEADAGQIQQVLVNVAVNAAQAMPDGGRITFETRVAHLDQEFVRTRPELEPGDYVEVVIGDTGVGIPPDVAERVFDPFFTTKTEGRGTGLGLSVVYGIVRNHKGHVTLDSTVGLGTTVRVYLPILDRVRQAERVAATSPPSPPRATPERPAPDSHPPHPFERVTVVQVDRRRPRPSQDDSSAARPGLPGPPAMETSPADSQESLAPRDPVPPPGPGAAPEAAKRAGAPVKGRILVIDDEGAIREMARDVLQSNGYEVVTAVDGVDGLDVFRREWGRVDLVLLDMVMPRMGGLETFRRLLGMDRSVRVLLCSGFADNDKAQRAIKEGALALLQKPFSVSELLGRIERALGQR
jgi:signal transduction histidine kinase/ActR/RegA family two-component response regulator